MKSEQIVSAQVVLAAAEGSRPNPESRITTENIRQWIPSAETVLRVSGEFGDVGFETGPCVGNSFSITGPVSLFESCFQTKLQQSGGGVQFAGDGYELAAEKIPPALQSQVVAVTFSPPPEFGPGAMARMV